MRLYDRVCRAEFLTRPNRFLAHCRLTDNTEAVCHVKNTGRCRELLIPGAEVYLAENADPRRKTHYDLVTVRKGDILVNLNSQAPNRVFQHWAAQGGFLPELTELRPETRYGDSRFDFAFAAGEKRGFIEVKGVTLEENGIVLFPDAPTQRGTKHLRELEKCAAGGYGAAVLLVVQMGGVSYFTPNWKTDPAFADALAHARAAGVEIWCYDCLVTPREMALHQPVEIRLA